MLQLSSRFRNLAPFPRGLRGSLHVAAGTAVLLGPPAASGALWAETPRFADVVRISAAELPAFDGYSVEQLAVMACSRRPGPAAACRPIPCQVDERDSEGRWALEEGPQPSRDDPPNALDANDDLIFMASDAGDAIPPNTLPTDGPVAEVALTDRDGGTTRWTYVVALRDAAQKATTSYVDYDPAADRAYGRRVSLAFRGGIPSSLVAAEDENRRDGAELLDRFKVRGTATFLWGVLRFSRNEDDVTSEFVAWRKGPIRVIRRQRQWVHIGWGIRSPTFGSYTYFYRDCAELPVSLHLNFPPTYFFGAITIRAFLDFRDLRGWQLLRPDVDAPLYIDGTASDAKAALNDVTGSWFALRGPQVTLVQELALGSTLATVRQRLLYREDGTNPEPPEALRGQLPAVGYQLDRWQDVGAGTHQLTSVSYALPPQMDVRAFMRSRRSPLLVTVRALR